MNKGVFHQITCMTWYNIVFHTKCVHNITLHCDTAKNLSIQA